MLGSRRIIMGHPPEEVDFTPAVIAQMQPIVLMYMAKRDMYASGLPLTRISQLRFAQFCNDMARTLGAVMPLMSDVALEAFKEVVESGQMGIENIREQDALVELLGCLIGLRVIAAMERERNPSQ